MNSILIDMIFVGFLLVISFFGYKRGFITRLYDLSTTILVLLLTVLVTPYVSQAWTVYNYNKDDLIASMIGVFVNYVLVFIIILVVLIIVKKIIGLFIKPILKSLTDKFKVTSFMDKTLGVALSFVEGVFITYLVLILAFIPFQSSSTQLLDETVLTKQVLKIVPDVSENVINLSKIMHESKDNTSSSLQNMTTLLLTADKLNVIDQATMDKLLKESIVNELKKEKISLSSGQIEHLEDLLKETGYNSNDIKSILKNINASDK
ncbi:MAG: CvpA family protein [Coprobacillus sp.]